MSSKRLIGLLCLIMFLAYGIKGLLIPYDAEFWIFYVSLCTFTVWIAFRFMSAEKALKYNIMGQLSKFKMQKAVEDVVETEEEMDEAIQPDLHDKKDDKGQPKKDEDKKTSKKDEMPLATDKDLE